MAGNVSSGRASLWIDLQLVVQRFLLDPLGLGPVTARVQVGQPLHDDVLASSTATASFCSRYRLQRRFAGLDLLALLGELLAEPVGRFLRGVELELEVLLDVRLGQRVGHVGGELRDRWT